MERLAVLFLTLYAVGFSLTYGISGLANFAHGALYILSGFVAWSLLNQAELPYFVVSPSLYDHLRAYRVWHLLGLLLRVRGIPLAEIVVTFAAGVAILELLTWKGFYGIQYSLPLFVEGGVEIGKVSSRLSASLCDRGWTGLGGPSMALCPSYQDWIWPSGEWPRTNVPLFQWVSSPIG